MEEQMNVENVKDGNGKDGGTMKTLNGERKKTNLQSLFMCCCYRFGLQQMFQCPCKQCRICQ